MVLALELMEEEVLEGLKKVLKRVTVILHTVLEYRVDRPSPSISCYVLRKYFMSFFLVLTLLFFGCL
jgi:hypothetical protein